MGNKDKKKRNEIKRQDKNDLPILDSDHDFLKAFEKKEKDNQKKINKDLPHKNKHGVQVLDHLSREEGVPQNLSEQDFAQLLEKSLKNKKSSSSANKTQISVKKRLKRYPPVEIELDLHGFNAIGAEVKARSFIHTCKHRGYFTIRIIVGKGLHSDLGPVLPDVVEDLLREMKKKDLVIGYKWDKKKKSKSGAVIVYIKQFEQFE